MATRPTNVWSPPEDRARTLPRPNRITKLELPRLSFKSLRFLSNKLTSRVLEQKARAIFLLMVFQIPLAPPKPTQQRYDLTNREFCKDSNPPKLPNTESIYAPNRPERGQWVPWRRGSDYRSMYSK